MESTDKEKIEKLAQKIFLIKYQFMYSMILNKHWEGYDEDDMTEYAEISFEEAQRFYQVQKDYFKT